MHLLTKNKAVSSPRSVPAAVPKPASTSLAEIIGQVLTHAGIEAEVICNGPEAIVCVQESICGYALMCSDVQLPGADGWTVLEFVRTGGRAVSADFGGADGSILDTLRTSEARGQVAAFRQPFRRAEVQQTLAEVFPYL